MIRGRRRNTADFEEERSRCPPDGGKDKPTAAPQKNKLPTPGICQCLEHALVAVIGLGKSLKDALDLVFASRLKGHVDQSVSQTHAVVGAIEL